MTTTIDLLSRVVYVERLVVERLVVFTHTLVFFRCLVRGCGKVSKMKKKNNKSFNIKLPGPRIWKFMSNDLLFLHWFSSAVSYEAAGKAQR